MSNEKHFKNVNSIWGKLLTVIAIPFVIYYCSSKPNEKKKDDAQKKAIENWKTRKEKPSESEEIKRKVNDILSNSRNSK